MILTQQLILGLLVGGLYGLAAAGLSLTFGVLRVLNVAHGELLMLGGYGTFWLFTLWKIDPFLSLLGVAPAMFVLGLVLYGALFRFVVKAHEETRIKNSLLIGFGLTLVLHALAIQLWTADERAVTTAYCRRRDPPWSLCGSLVAFEQPGLRLCDSGGSAFVSHQDALGPSHSGDSGRLGSCRSHGDSSGTNLLACFRPRHRARRHRRRVW